MTCGVVISFLYPSSLIPLIAPGNGLYPALRHQYPGEGENAYLYLIQKNQIVVLCLDLDLGK